MITGMYEGRYFYITDTKIITDDEMLEFLYDYYIDEISPSEGSTSNAMFNRIARIMDVTLINRVDSEPKQGEVQ